MACDSRGLTYPELPRYENETEWEYDMRREMQEVIPGLYLGPYSVASRKKLEYLKSHAVTHIVCIRHPVEKNRIKANFPDYFNYLVLDIIDSSTENIIRFFPQVKQFIDDCFKGGGKVLVHGSVGMSRSAAVVMAYLMETYGLAYRDAHNFVQGRRFCVNPNEGFVQQLREYEAIYPAKQQIASSHGQGDPSGSLTRGLKRTLDSDDVAMAAS